MQPTLVHDLARLEIQQRLDDAAAARRAAAIKRVQPHRPPELLPSALGAVLAVLMRPARRT